MTVDVRKEAIQQYLEQAFEEPVTLEGIGPIGDLSEQGIKGFGYGKPLLLRYRRGEQVEEAVLSVMKGDAYGHQFFWDRAAILLFQYATEAHMEKHVRPKGIGYVDETGKMIPVRRPQEFFILHEKLEGYDYFKDLVRIQKGDYRSTDRRLVEDFARWLARVHAHKHTAPDLYHRRIRELIGSSECIYGLIDGYPHPYEDFAPKRFQALEHTLVDWRWRLRGYPHRLAAVHGDFHPWNVLVTEEGAFMTLDRSRGEWGEPADDIATMTANYLLFGLSDASTLKGPFWEMYLAFWETYLEATQDREICEVIAPFYVFRGLVIASPQWYPTHPPALRRSLLHFLEAVLQESHFDYREINRYLKG